MNTRQKKRADPSQQLTRTVPFFVCGMFFVVAVNVVKACWANYDFIACLPLLSCTKLLVDTKRRQDKTGQQTKPTCIYGNDLSLSLELTPTGPPIKYQHLCTSSKHKSVGVADKGSWGAGNFSEIYRSRRQLFENAWIRQGLLSVGNCSERSRSRQELFENAWIIVIPY